MAVEELSEHTACFACGYNLKGLKSDGVCPECGLRIAFTLKQDDVSQVDLEAARWELEQRRHDSNLDRSEEQTRRYDAQLDVGDQINARSIAQLDQFDQIQTRWNSVLDRAEAILTRLEKASEKLP